LWLENPPLKFEELKEGMPIWDDKQNKWYLLREVNIKKNRTVFVNFYGDTFNIKFEKNRFYRREVK
jgi:hypothetical protein